MPLYVISDAIDNHLTAAQVPVLEAGQKVIAPRHQTLEVDKLSGTDSFLVVAPIESVDSAFHLGGAIRLAVENGALAIVAFQVRLQQSIHTFTDRLIPLSTKAGHHAQPVRAVQPAFHQFFTAYSQTATGLSDLPPDPDRLAEAKIEGVTSTAAICAPLGKGTVYVLPYHRPDALPETLRSLMAAVRAHRTGGGEPPPEFLDALTLPGETDLRGKIAQLESDLSSNTAQLSALVRFKAVVGRASGDEFEQLAIETLNSVFDGSDFRAEDREELFEEDFWIVDGDQDFALAEAKGINSGIGRQDVNKVDDHREALELPPEIPGILIVNIARKSDDLGARQAEVHPKIVTHARNQNVLVLRSIDLFGLVSMALDGKDGVAPLIEAARDGGGWLEVADGKATHHAK